MRNISIITGSDLRQVQGVNYFIKSFLECNQYFKTIKVERVYSSLQVINVNENETIPIGVDSGTKEFVVRIGFRTLLRKLLTDKFYPFALFRYELNHYFNSTKSIKNYFNDNHPVDCLIFQELGCAYYYFKSIEKKAKGKLPHTVLVVHTENDSGSMIVGAFEGWGRKDMQRRFNKRRDYVYSKIDKVVYISKKAYNNSILPIDKRGFVYNGSPCLESVFKENDNSIIQFVTVGSFAGRKGQDKIIEAMSLMSSSLLKKMHLTLVGDGPELEKVKAKVVEYNLCNYVDFLGKRNDVPEILKKMDVFIMPSLVEGLPMSAIEAMRAGLYLILTDTGGNVELCEEKCGEICTRDPENIMKHMMNAIQGTVISFEQKRNSCNRFLSTFSLKSMAKGYENLLLSL